MAVSMKSRSLLSVLALAVGFFACGDDAGVPNEGTDATVGIGLTSISFATPVMLVPDFDPEMISYEFTIGTEVTSLDVTPVSADPNADILVSGIAVESSQSVTISLQNGEDLITIETVNTAGERRDYSIKVRRSAAVTL
jgi:hypothetical protein